MTPIQRETHFILPPNPNFVVKTWTAYVGSKDWDYLSEAIDFAEKADVREISFALPTKEVVRLTLRRSTWWERFFLNRFDAWVME